MKVNSYQVCCCIYIRFSIFDYSLSGIKIKRNFQKKFSFHEKPGDVFLVQKKENYSFFFFFFVLLIFSYRQVFPLAPPYPPEALLEQHYSSSPRENIRDNNPLCGFYGTSVAIIQYFGKKQKAWEGCTTGYFGQSSQGWSRGDINVGGILVLAQDDFSVKNNNRSDFLQLLRSALGASQCFTACKVAVPILGRKTQYSHTAKKGG